MSDLAFYGPWNRRDDPNNNRFTVISVDGACRVGEVIYFAAIEFNGEIIHGDFRFRVLRAATAEEYQAAWQRAPRTPFVYEVHTD